MREDHFSIKTMMEAEWRDEYKVGEDLTSPMAAFLGVFSVGQFGHMICGTVSGYVASTLD